MEPNKNLRISYLVVDSRELRKLQHAVQQIPLRLHIPREYFVSELRKERRDTPLSALIADTEETGLSMLLDQPYFFMRRRRTIQTLREMIRATAAGVKMVSGHNGIDFSYMREGHRKTMHIGFFTSYPLLYRQAYHVE